MAEKVTTPNDVPSSAIKGLTDWEHIAELVDAFGGGDEAIIAIAIIASAVVVVVIAFLIICYMIYRLHARTKVRLAELGIDISGRAPWLLRWLALLPLRSRR